MSNPTEPHVRYRNGPEGCVVDLDTGELARWDAPGRWSTFRTAQTLYRRSLDGGVLRQDGGGWRPLPAETAHVVHQAVWHFAHALRDDVQHGRLTLDPTPGVESGRELLTYLDRAIDWTAGRLEAEIARFAAAYPEAVPVLPPDRYHDVVVLPSLGCPYNQCSFCTLHRNTAYRILTEPEFDAHLQRVVELHGAGVRARGGVFLGSGSALSIPNARLMRILDRVGETFGLGARGIAGFLDPDHAPHRATEGFGDLSRHGLRLAVLGLETGAPELRHALGKSPDLAPTRMAVERLRAAGIRCGLTVLVGAGGAPAIVAHREATAAAIHALELDARDVVYLSPLREPPAPPPAWLEGEVENFRTTLLGVTRARVVAYEVDRYRAFA